MTEANKSRLKKVNAVAILVILIVGYNLWPTIKASGKWPGFFYQCIALSIFLSVCQFLLDQPKGTGLRRFYWVFFWLATSNLLDEIFFDPKAFQLNEYIFAVIVAAHQVYLHIKSNARK